MLTLVGRLLSATPKPSREPGGIGGVVVKVWAESADLLLDFWLRADDELAGAVRDLPTYSQVVASVRPIPVRTERGIAYRLRLAGVTAKEATNGQG